MLWLRGRALVRGVQRDVRRTAGHTAAPRRRAGAPRGTALDRSGLPARPSDGGRGERRRGCASRSSFHRPYALTARCDDDDPSPRGAIEMANAERKKRKDPSSRRWRRGLSPSSSARSPGCANASTAAATAGGTVTTPNTVLRAAAWRRGRRAPRQRPADRGAGSLQLRLRTAGRSCCLGHPYCVVDRCHG
jgi:hypothetical protein